jgi:DNA-binding transcriptional ArsR family regulator
MPAAAAATDAELERLFETVSGYFALLAEPTRLKILNALCDGERSVGDIVQRVASTQTNVSRHLNLMYGRGVLTRRREGAMTFYAVADANVVALCRSACTHIAGLAEDHTVHSRALRRFMPKH